MIVVATEEEFEYAKRRWYGERIVKTGVGGLNVYRTLKGFDRQTEIVNFGYAGSNVLAVGKELTVSRCALYHPNVAYEEPVYNLGGETPCYTSNDFVLSTEIKEPVLFDMELAYILAMGFENVKAIKIVSDNLSLEEYQESIE